MLFDVLKADWPQEGENTYLSISIFKVFAGEHAPRLPYKSEDKKALTKLMNFSWPEAG